MDSLLHLQIPGMNHFKFFKTTTPMEISFYRGFCVYSSDTKTELVHKIVVKTVAQPALERGFWPFILVVMI